LHYHLIYNFSQAVTVNNISHQGGIKAVIWTDFLQGVVMVVASIVVVILGVIHVGGVNIVWERNREAGRIRIFE
jgi:sodium/proline symporter